MLARVNQPQWCKISYALGQYFEQGMGVGLALFRDVWGLHWENCGLGSEITFT